MSMENHTYQYTDEDINKCIQFISKWMLSMATKMSMGDVFLNSIRIEKTPTNNVRFPYNWSLKINYSEYEQ